MRIVITGATGNVGSALVRRLADDGGHELVGVVRRPPASEVSFPAMEWVAVDLTDDADTGALHAACEGADAVVHLAWGFQPSHREAHLRALGVGGTERVIDAVVATGVPHLVHMSSVGAYSPKQDDEPVDESWPTGGVPSSPYSRHKATAERLLDSHEQAHPGRVVTRLRPGIVGQRTAGSALLRYAVPGLVPARMIGHVGVLPLDRRLCLPMVHADDVADAIERVVEGRVPGPFNLAADPAVTTAAIAGVLGARLVHVPAPVLRAALTLAWKARVEQLDPGWLDLGFAVPLMDTSRASVELGWAAQVNALSVLEEVVSGMREGASDASPVLRPRSVQSQVLGALRDGPVSYRHEP